MEDSEKIKYLYRTIDELRDEYKQSLQKNKTLAEENYQMFKKLSAARDILCKNQHRFKDSKHWEKVVWEFIVG